MLSKTERVRGLDCTYTFKYDYIRANCKVISSSYWELKFRIIANCLDGLFLWFFFIQSFAISIFI